VSEESSDIEVLERESRVFHPPKVMVEETNVKKWMNTHGITDWDELLERAKDLDWFWGEMVKETDVKFYKSYEKVLEWGLNGMWGENIISFMTL
jgi:acetyl-CoA synthetase